MNNGVVIKWSFQSEYQAMVSAVNQSGRSDLVGLLCLPFWVCPQSVCQWPFLLALINSRDWIQT